MAGADVVVVVEVPLLEETRLVRVEVGVTVTVTYVVVVVEATASLVLLCKILPINTRTSRQ